MVSRVNILLAEEDENGYQLFHKALLEVLPVFNIYRARNGCECPQALKTSFSPDLIFLNVNLPLRSGLECLPFIRGKKELSDVPVIVFSTSPVMKNIEIAYKHDATLYLVRPTEFKTLVQLLKRVFHLLGRSKKELRSKENFVVMEGKIDKELFG